MSIQYFQLVDDVVRPKIRSLANDELDIQMQLINDRFQIPLDVGVSGNIITIGAGTVQTYESAGNDSVSGSYKWRLPPINSNDVDPVESTLNLANGSVTGDFASPAFSLDMTANYYVQMGIELRDDSKLYVVWGDQAAALGSTTIPTFSSDAFPVLTANLQNDGVSGSWNFLTPDKEDIEVIRGAGGSGGGGDSSFKLQSVAANGSAMIKGGYMTLADARIIATYDGSGTTENDFGGDLSFDLDSLVTPVNDTTYYVYIDTYTLPAATVLTETGRKLTPVISTNFVLLTTDFESVDQFRYVKVGVVRRATAAWATTPVVTYPSKVQVPTVVVSPLVKTVEKVVGATGDVDQIAAGHVLAQASFPSAAYANTSFFNLINVNDGNTVLAHDLTNTPSTPFTGTGILGVASTCANMNGSSHYLKSTDIHFDPDDANFTFGAWFKPASSWSTAATLFSQWTGTGNFSFIVSLDGAGKINIYASITGSDTYFNEGSVSSLSSWNHIAIKYEASSNTFTLYVNGTTLFTLVLSGNLHAVGASRNFVLGANNGGSNFYSGLVDEFFFCNGTAFSDDEIWKVFSAKISHNVGLAPANQDWRSQISSGDFRRDLLDYIVDIDENDLYVDLSGQLSTATAKLDLFNKGLAGSVSAARAKEWIDTAANLDTMFAATLAHGLPQVPKLILEVDVGSGYWEQKDAPSFLKASATLIAQNGVGDLEDAFGASTSCKVTAFCGANASFIQAKSWQTAVKTSAYTMASWDEVFANPSGGLTLTLPPSPSLGDRVRVIDFDGSWSETDYVTVGRNGKKINGASDDMTLSTPNNNTELVYNGTDDWRII